MSVSISLIEQLAKHLMRPIDAATRHKARLHLLDWLACVAGARGSRLRSMSLRAQHGGEDWLGNILEMDDVHREGRLHPGPVIWPAALSDADMDDVLNAAVIGYEAMISVGATFDNHHYAYWHPTCTAGVFGAAATFMADAGPLDEITLTQALAFAGTTTGGLWQTRHENDDAKQFHVARAIAGGSDAAGAAMKGLRGPRFILEGPQGLYAATCRDPNPMVLTEQWRIHEVSFKPWAACRHAHPVIDCALELRAAGKLHPPFHVETYADAIAFCDKPDPTSEQAAKFSLQHAVAVIAAGRNAAPADFTPDAIVDLAPLRAQVTVKEAPEISARYPAHFGARLNGMELVDTRGDPERPVSESDIISKMRMLADWGGLDTGEADRATELALTGNDGGAIGKMLDRWLA